MRGARTTVPARPRRRLVGRRLVGRGLVGRRRSSIHEPGRGPARAGRAALLAVVVLALLAAVFVVGGGWYFSGQIRAEALTLERGPQQPPSDLEGYQRGPLT